MIIRIVAPALQLLCRHPLTVVLDEHEKIEQAALACFVKQLVSPKHDRRQRSAFDRIEKRWREINFGKVVLISFIVELTMAMNWTKVRSAADCIKCTDCGEPFCAIFDVHYADCHCVGSMQEDEYEYRTDAAGEMCAARRIED